MAHADSIESSVDSLATGIYAMPLLGDKEAPRKFTGKRNTIKRFLKTYEALCKKHRVTKDFEKCEAILEYCSGKVVRVIESLTSYVAKDWAQLRVELLDVFDAERDEKAYSIKDLEEFCRAQQRVRITSMTPFKEYTVNYRSIAGDLLRTLPIIGLELV